MNRRKAIAAVGAILTLGATIGTSPGGSQEVGTAAKLLKAASPLGDRTLGQKDAPVVLIEYASATCPHCAEFHENLLPQIKKEYIDTGKVRFIFREFPLDQLALGAFMLTRCLPEDRYFEALDLLFREQKVWAKSSNPADELFKITQTFGMDRTGFEACVKREDLAKAIIESTKQASSDFAIKGTPALFVNGKMIDGHKDMAEVKAAIDQAIGQQP